MSNWETMNAPNLGLLFYKQIYKEQEIKKLMREKESELFFEVDDKEPEFNNFYAQMYRKDISTYDTYHNEIDLLCTASPPLFNTFPLFTTYPGLLIGSGYAHDTKSVGDFKIGFYFDHSSGLPVLPGSSVKGTLRSAFEMDVTEEGQNYTGDKSVGFITLILKNALSITKSDNEQTIHAITALLDILTIKEVERVKTEIFGSEKSSGKDVFFDAVIDQQLTSHGQFISNDFITPHYPDLLKNPKPLQFLKLLPNVAFRFTFRLSDAGWGKEVKERLFESTLLMIGIGAKTNVGYGQLSKTKILQQQEASAIPEINVKESSPEAIKKNRQSEKQQLQDKLDENRFNRLTSGKGHELHRTYIPDEAPAENSFIIGNLVKAVVAGIDDNNLKIQLMVKEGSIIPIPKPDKYFRYIIGQKLEFIVSSIVNGKIKGLKPNRTKR